MQLDQGAGSITTGSVGALLVDDAEQQEREQELRTQLAAAQAAAAEHQQTSLSLGADLAVMERKQRNQVGTKHVCALSLHPS